MDKYTDRYHPQYVPGTYSIYTSAVIRHQHYIALKRYKYLLHELNLNNVNAVNAANAANASDSLLPLQSPELEGGLDTLNRKENEKLEKRKRYHLSENYNYTYRRNRKFENIPDLKTKYGVILQPQPTNSPNDPLNWSPMRKAVHFFIVLLTVAFTSAVANDASAPTDSINELTGVSYDALNNSAGILFVAIAVSAWLYSPLNYLFGRKIVLVLGVLCALIGSIWYGRLQNVGDAYGSQVLIGFSLGSTSAHAQLCLASIFFRHQLGSVITIYNLAYALGTYLGPLVANFIGFKHGFRWVGYSGAIASAGILVIIIFFLEENAFDYSKYNNNKMEDITLNLGFIQKGLLSNDESNDLILQGYDDKEWCFRERYFRLKLPEDGEIHNLKWLLKSYTKMLLLPIQCLRFPPVLYAGCMLGIQNAILSFYLTTEDTELYDPPFNYTEAQVALMNIPCIIGSVIGCLYAGSLTDYFILWMARKNEGILESEHRLYFAFLSGSIGAIGLLMFGLGISRCLDWRVFYVGLGFISYMFSSSNNLAMLYVMDTYKDMILECLVAANFINNIFGCVFTFVCSPWLNGSGIEKTYIALAVITLGVMYAAGIFIKYGKLWRKRSHVLYVELLEARQRYI
jgi:MFS family permease